VTTNQFAYNGAGDLITLTDGKGQNTAWKYDLYGRVTNKLDNLADNLFAYGYDSDNRLTSRWTPAKGTTLYRYDGVGNLTNVDYSGGSNSMSSVYLTYDAINELTNMVDGVGSTMYGYDAAGELLSEDGPWAFDTVSYSYLNRHRASLTLAAPNSSAWTENYGYDSAGRWTSVTSPAGAFSYTLGGASPASPLISQILLPSGAFVTNTYDSVARLLSTKLLSPGSAVLNSHVYSYNQANQRTQQVFSAGNYINYTYDNMGQLISARGKESGGTPNRLQEQFCYTYDAAGNLNYRTNDDALTEAFNVNSLNELTTITRSGTLTVAGTTTSPATNVTVNGSIANRYSDNTFALGGFGITNGSNTFAVAARDSYGRQDSNSVTVNLPSTNTYTSDANGNLRSDGTRYFAYDDENQLTSVWVTNVWRSDFVYDGKMRRRIRKEYTWQSSAWVETNEVHYIYDGNVVIQERDANNLPQVSYTRGIDLSGSLQGAGGIGGLLARTANSLLLIPSSGSSANAYYHADGNGNVTMLINASNAVVAKYEYDPYGNVLSKSGSLADANLYRFSSKEYHPNSGLVYYLYRFYDLNMQRWPNRDPIRELGFEAVRAHYARKGKPTRGDGDNAFQFVHNTPITKWDYMGLDDPGCDSPATSLPCELPGAVDCYLACCAQHDRCFKVNHCKAASSWAQILCPTKCGHCARQVVGCFAGCFFGGNGPNFPPYYCATLDRYYYNWDDIPAECFQNENGNKPPKPSCYP
jgi:RHS repeat-associated protein